MENEMTQRDQPRNHESTKKNGYGFVFSCFRGTSLVLGLLAAFLLAGLASGAAGPTTVDEVFAKYRSSTPGCAVGVAIGGKRVVIKGYGMADLEHDVPIGEETIFEAGSVAKQFTAAAVLLLARDGKLSIDDPVRQYVPELP